MKRLEEKCKHLRTVILNLDQNVLDLMSHDCYELSEEHRGQHSEMRANTMLAYRHLEDARMRLGKVMQQIQGGTSIYDKAKQGA